MIGGFIGVGGSEHLLETLVENGLAAGVIIGRAAGGLGIHIDGDFHTVAPPGHLHHTVLDEKPLMENGVHMGPGEKFAGPQFFVVAEGAGLVAALQHLVALPAVILLMGTVFQRVAQMAVHVDQFVGLHVGDIDHLVQIFKKTPLLRHTVFAPSLPSYAYGSLYPSSGPKIKGTFRL